MVLTATEPGGYSRKFYARRLNPEIQPLTLLIYQFWPKRCPLRITSIDKWYPFHIPGLEFCILYCKVNALSSKYEYITDKTRTFSRLFYSQKMHLSSNPLIVGLFTDRNARFPYPFIYTSTSEITTLLYTVKPRFTPHCYGQFALSLGKESPYIFSKFNLA